MEDEEPGVVDGDQVNGRIGLKHHRHPTSHGLPNHCFRYEMIAMEVIVTTNAPQASFSAAWVSTLAP